MQFESLQPQCSAKPVDADGVRDHSVSSRNVIRLTSLADLRCDLIAVLDELDRMNLLLAAAQVQAALDALDNAHSQK